MRHYRNKTYIAFDADSDMNYYRLLRAWTVREGIDFNMYDAHEINHARDTSKPESIEKQLSVRMANSKVFVLLVGEETASNHGFVEWEIKHAMKLGLPIIVSNINGKEGYDKDRCPSCLKDYPFMNVPFKANDLMDAMEQWPDEMADKSKRKFGNRPFQFNDDGKIVLS